MHRPSRWKHRGWLTESSRREPRGKNDDVMLAPVQNRVLDVGVWVLLVVLCQLGRFNEDAS